MTCAAKFIADSSLAARLDALRADKIGERAEKKERAKGENQAFRAPGGSGGRPCTLHAAAWKTKGEKERSKRMIFSRGPWVAWARVFAMGAALILAVTLWIATMMVAAAPETAAQQRAAWDIEKTVSVPATQPWTDTGIDLRGSDLVDIQATGVIKIATSDPGKTPDGDQNCIPSQHNEPWAADFIAPDLHCWALIGGVSGGPIKEIGSSYRAGAGGNGGRLYLGVNDGRSDFGDNSGAWTAHIRVWHR